MSGHSKWSTIKHKKGAKDAQRSKVFLILSGTNFSIRGVIGTSATSTAPAAGRTDDATAGCLCCDRHHR